MLTPFSRTAIVVVFTIAFVYGELGADDVTVVPADAIRSAIAKSLPLLEKGARGSVEQRKHCFNCHNQGLPVMALVTAQSRGFEIDVEHLKQQIQFTADFLGRNKDGYRKGEGQAGQVDMAGYALWTLDNGNWPADETTAAVAEYFLRRQSDQEYWSNHSDRPPSEKSDFTSTYVALRGLAAFGVPEQKDRIEKRADQVRAWLLKTPAEDTEDRVFRLRALHLIGNADDAVSMAADELLKTQQTDGGWAQLDQMQSDAYATGTALVTLRETGGLKADDPRCVKGLGYLLSIQLEDGSWHVKSRSKPFQTYFESGYPHGTDQFISSAAASWATTALALALPKESSTTK